MNVNVDEEKDFGCVFIHEVILYGIFRPPIWRIFELEAKRKRHKLTV